MSKNIPYYHHDNNHIHKNPEGDGFLQTKYRIIQKDEFPSFTYLQVLLKLKPPETFQPEVMSDYVGKYDDENKEQHYGNELDDEEEED